MNESVCRGNLINKLESFFDSCILQGWRDSILALQSAWEYSGWAENRIVQPCIDSVVEKILAHPSQVSQNSCSLHFVHLWFKELQNTNHSIICLISWYELAVLIGKHS
jgi:hypothetical protein